MVWFAVVLVFCIGILLLLPKRLKTGSDSRDEFAYPYLKRDALLTPAERSLLGVLERIADGKFRVYVQVRLADLLVVRSGLERRAYKSAFNKIVSKHVDFVICRIDTLELLCAIELDDSSHARADRKARDEVLEKACQAAGLPLVRFVAKASYKIDEVRLSLESVLKVSDAPLNSGNAVARRSDTKSDVSAGIASGDAGPTCPKCGGLMLLRTVKSGVHAGSQLWGCKSYPACRGYIPVKA